MKTPDSIDLDLIFDKIGMVFDSGIGTYVHKQTRLPLTVMYDESKKEIVLLDQTKLPFEVTTWKTSDWKRAALSGIKGMVVRGSQAIGCAAGYCMVLAANSYTSSGKQALTLLEKAAEIIKNARPTAVPLMWAVNLTLDFAKEAVETGFLEVVDAVKVAADYVLASDLIMNFFLRREGIKYLEDGDVILTHCNAGSLSSSYGGHALGILEEAIEKNLDIMVVSKETRPRCQGFKLTTWELLRTGVPVVIITDNMITNAIDRYNISKVIVGADRVSRDGSLANKVGTHDIARVVSFYNIPFYVATSYSTVDLKTFKGRDIPIEERDHEEILYYYRLEAKNKRESGFLSEKSLPQWPPKEMISLEKLPSRGKVALFNPAFDITPPTLIDTYITDIGSYPPDQIQTLTPQLIREMVRKNLEEWGLSIPFL